MASQSHTQTIETEEQTSPTGAGRGEAVTGPTRKPGQAFRHPRLAREWKTVAAMIHIYCRDQHGEALCPDCEDLERYVALRLQHCRFGKEKPTCANCPVHCYQRDRCDKIKAIMRYAGPRMVWEHSWLSFRHFLDGWLQNRAAVDFEKTKATRTAVHLHNHA